MKRSMIFQRPKLPRLLTAQMSGSNFDRLSHLIFKPCTNLVSWDFILTYRRIILKTGVYEHFKRYEENLGEIIHIGIMTIITTMTKVKMLQ